MSKCIIVPVFNEYENINILLNEIYKNDFKDLIVIIAVSYTHSDAADDRIRV